MNGPLRWTLPSVDDGRYAFLLAATGLLLVIGSFVALPVRWAFVIIALLALALLLFLGAERWFLLEGESVTYGRGPRRLGGFDLTDADRLELHRDLLVAKRPPRFDHVLPLPRDRDERERVLNRARVLFPEFGRPDPPGLPIRWSLPGPRTPRVLVWAVRLGALAFVVLALLRRELLAGFYGFMLLPLADERPRSREFALTYASASRPYALWGRWSLDWPRVRRTEFREDRIILHASVRETVWNRGDGLVLELPEAPALRAEIEAAVRAKVACHEHG